MKLKGHRNAFSMVEVALALGIASFCLLVLFALVPVGLNSKKEAIQYTVAAGIASEVVSDLRSTLVSGTAMNSTRYGVTIPIAGASSSMTNNPQTFYLKSDGTTNGTGPALYRVSIGFNPPPLSGKTSTFVRILVTWPGQNYPLANTWPTNFNDSYEVVTSLDRN